MEQLLLSGTVEHSNVTR